MTKLQADASAAPGFGEGQDANGTDLLLLRRHLALSVEERLRLLEQQIEFAAELRRAAVNAVETPR